MSLLPYSELPAGSIASTVTRLTPSFSARGNTKVPSAPTLTFCPLTRTRASRSVRPLSSTLGDGDTNISGGDRIDSAGGVSSKTALTDRTALYGPAKPSSSCARTRQ
jgi:hypothetical protein